jgi:DNA polymerase
VLTLDFETRSPVDLKKCGVWKYAAHPETEVICLAYLWEGQRSPKVWVNPKFNVPGAPLPPVDIADTIEAHNAEFERAIWRHIMVPKFNCPSIPLSKWRCSAAMAAARALPRSLAGAGDALGLELRKDNQGHFLMLRMCKPRKPVKRERIDALLA